MLLSRRLINIALLSGLLFHDNFQRCTGFMTQAPVGHMRSHPAFSLYSATSDDVASMRVGEIKKELESYGISTKSFFEKSELVDALQKARADGLKPKSSASTASSSSSSTSSSSSSSSSSSTSSTSSSSEPKDKRPREERLQEEMEKCKSMKAGELKKELEERGVSTKSFFEKSEFVKALAEARVDGVDKPQPKENYAEYTNVEVITDDSAGPRKRQQEGQSQQQQQSSPFGGGSPFGGAGGGNPFGGGGMGGMGGLEDLLKNMGGGGAAGANPFGGGGNPFGGGGGANPFGGMGGMGDMMGKAQEMMKNPKVMELMTKAQSNPKIMKAMQECMSNPAAFAKYQNDPEVSEVINELKKYM